MKNLYSFCRTGLMMLALVCFTFYASAQTIATLPAPGKTGTTNAISIGSNLYEPGTVVVGAVPPNTDSKPVLVFLHGYTGNADTWFGDNDMYSRAYTDGYRTAFAVVYPDRSMWDNGSLFSQQLSLICNYYGVSKVVVVAHSKGGIDTDAALVHYGAYPKVNRVITLGTPHFGTPLADLAQSGWVWWLSAIFGQRNDATYAMQSGYMDYFRSITDGRSENRVPFRTLGSGSYYGSLWVSGVYLAANGGAWWNGGNDGVVNYRDSKRPNSTTLAKSSANHYDLAIGSSSWSTVKAQLPSSLSRESSQPDVEANFNPHEVVRSYYQIISGEAGTHTFSIEAGAQAVNIDVRQPSGSGEATLLNARNTNLYQGRRSRTDNDMLGRYSTQIALNRPSAGTYRLQSSEEFVAIISSEGGGYAQLSTDLKGNRRIYQAGEVMNLTLKLANAEDVGITGAQIIGSLRRTVNLQGEATPGEGQELSLKFKPTTEAGVYLATTPPINLGGVYNISIQANSAALNRSLTHSVAVLNPPLQTSTLHPLALTAYPNPSNGQVVQLRYKLSEESELQLAVFDTGGKQVYAWQGSRPAGEHDLPLPNTLVPGLYILQLNNGALTDRQKLLITK